MPNTPNITIGYDTTNSTLTANPDEYQAGQHGHGAKAITWGPESPVSEIEGIDIQKKNGATYNGTQPSQSGSSTQWTWSDPETGADTYEYVVSANVSGVGVVTLDPKIINT